MERVLVHGPGGDWREMDLEDAWPTLNVWARRTISPARASRAVELVRREACLRWSRHPGDREPALLRLHYYVSADEARDIDAAGVPPSEVVAELNRRASAARPSYLPNTRLDDAPLPLHVAEAGVRTEDALRRLADVAATTGLSLGELTRAFNRLAAVAQSESAGTSRDPVVPVDTKPAGPRVLRLVRLGGKREVSL